MEPIQLDDECWKILKGLSYSPKTPQMLARIYGMPVADAWNRVHFLEGLGLVHVVLTFINRDGRVSYFYEKERELAIRVGETASAYFQPAV